MAKEIELGNGYGYFCNIHDIENQYKSAPMFEPIYMNHSRYLDELEQFDRNNTWFGDALCSCSVFSFMVVIVFCIL